MTGKKVLRVSDYLEHIVAAVARIDAYVDSLSKADFFASTLVQDAVIRNFEIIGEAANKVLTVDPGFPRRYPELKLEQAYRMRNALAHGYDSVNLLVVWNTIKDELPSLKRQAAEILKASQSGQA